MNENLLSLLFQRNYLKPLSLCLARPHLSRTSTSIFLPLGRLRRHCETPQSNSSPVPCLSSLFPLWFQAKHSWFPPLSRNWSPGYVSNIKSARLNCGTVEPFLARKFLLCKVAGPLASFPFASSLDIIRFGVFQKRVIGKKKPEKIRVSLLTGDVNSIN